MLDDESLAALIRRRGWVYPSPTSSGQDTKQMPRSSEGGDKPHPYIGCVLHCCTLPRSDPTLELLCRREFRGENEGVKARLVDDGFVWVSLNTVTNRYGILFPNWVVICHPSFIFLIDMCFQSIHSKCPAAARAGFIPVLPTADKIQSKCPAAVRVGFIPVLPTFLC